MFYVWGAPQQAHFPNSLTSKSNSNLAKTEKRFHQELLQIHSTIEKTKEVIHDFIASSTLGFYYLLLFAI